MAHDKDGNYIEREFTDYDTTVDGRKVGIRAHKVTKDTAGTVSTVGQGSRDVKEGDYLVETNQPGVYDVQSEKDLEPFLQHQDTVTDDHTDGTPDTSPKKSTPGSLKR